MLTLPEFNQQLVDWLLWYNTERTHYALSQTSPLNYLINELGFSQMLWTHTVYLQIDHLLLQSRQRRGYARPVP